MIIRAARFGHFHEQFLVKFDSYSQGTTRHPLVVPAGQIQTFAFFIRLSISEEQEAVQSGWGVVLLDLCEGSYYILKELLGCRYYGSFIGKGNHRSPVVRAEVLNQVFDRFDHIVEPFFIVHGTATVEDDTQIERQAHSSPLGFGLEQQVQNEVFRATEHSVSTTQSRKTDGARHEEHLQRESLSNFYRMFPKTVQLRTRHCLCTKNKPQG
jgi:hypothetical protein